MDAHDRLDITNYTPLSVLGEMANAAIRQYILPQYRQGKSDETLRGQMATIRQFELYLAGMQHSISGMYEDLSRWQGVTYGLVAGFQQWLLQSGYAIGTINVRTTTIKSYCQLAHQAGYIPSMELTAIQGVKNINHKAGRNIDEKREEKRVGKKKGKAILLSEGHMTLLKRKLRSAAEKDGEGARDYLLLCLLADHGLRCGEVAALETRNLDTFTGNLVFYRRKVDKTQTHHLTADTLEAAGLYLRRVTPGEKLFIGRSYARKGAVRRQADAGITARAINGIVGRLGHIIGVTGLSPHDLRHYWATVAIRKGTNVKALQQAGGWNSPYMPLRYAEESEVANQDVRLS